MANATATLTSARRVGSEAGPRIGLSREFAKRRRLVALDADLRTDRVVDRR